eukprot:scaffold567948_cov55-Attheya_sp.AAC.2
MRTLAGRNIDSLDQTPTRSHLLADVALPKSVQVRRTKYATGIAYATLIYSKRSRCGCTAS